MIVLIYASPILQILVLDVRFYYVKGVFGPRNLGEGESGVEIYVRQLAPFLRKTVILPFKTFLLIGASAITCVFFLFNSWLGILFKGNVEFWMLKNSITSLSKYPITKHTPQQTQELAFLVKRRIEKQLYISYQRENLLNMGRLQVHS